MKYLREFETEADVIVDAYPNVVLVNDTKKVIYNMEIPQSGCDPDCVILYTTYSGNINTNLNDYNICNANFISNTYENGQGTLLYDAPITSINESAFDDNISDISTVVLPATVTYIGDWFCYANIIDAIYIKSITPPENLGIICEQGSVGIIYVPMESVGAYKAKISWHASKINGYNFE